MRAVQVAGVGMIPFRKPSQSLPYHVMGAQAARAALTDAGVEYHQIQQAYAGYVYGDSTCGQAALYGLGVTGIPIINVTNNCATGSSALWLARQAVATGAADCVLVLGFEQMTPGALGMAFDDRDSPLDRGDTTRARLQDDGGVPFAHAYFGGAGVEYARRHGTRPETFAAIVVKARRHAAANPNAVFRDPVTVEQVLASPAIYGPLTRLQCCPPTSGAASAVLCSTDFARTHGLPTTVTIRAQALTTDTPGTFDGDTDMMRLVGYDMTRRAARQVYESSGVDPGDIPVVELHDCFTTNELISYEALGLTPEGTAEKFVADAANTYGGQVVVNPSGGLLAKGHPLGATGLAQVAELSWQLRGAAAARQVDGVRLGLAHNIGLGGACVVTLLEATR
ncbi:lipid-transfer protein [Micromonospora sp. NPDC049799]|uniref:lipid-transfer protein n=1 Tax=Micromonospora sp. NPDC049799 TaxID=3154741 RepID=UPI0034044C8D